MPCLKLSDGVCYPRDMIEGHDRHRLVMCEVQGCQGIPHPTSSDIVYCPKAKIVFYARRHPIVCI